MAERAVLTAFVAVCLALDRSTGQPISSCDFGVSLSQSLCGWTQQNLLLGWRFGSSCTPTQNTGPCEDHTGIRNGNFLFIESSYVKNGTTYRLNSPVLTTDGSSPVACLQFYYHMYGEDIGILNIYFNNGVLWTRSGQQGSLWLRADVDLNLAPTGSVRNFNISIEGVIISNKPPLADLKGDIAIDDISVTPGSCLNSSEEPASTIYPNTVLPPVGTTTADDGFLRLCTFENDMCGFYNKRGANAWTRSNGLSVANLSGPAADKTLSSAAGGFALFKPPLGIEERDGGAMLVSPRLGAGATCLSLFYYAFGNNAGSFNVYADVDAEDVLLWSTSGIDRSQWLPAKIPLPNDTVAVSLEGVADSAHNFFIAVDELLITDTPCDDLQSYACDFGTALSPRGCDYVDSSNLLRWLTGSSCSLTQGTGPCADHTGNRLGAFKYIESSYRSNGTKALLNSPIFVKNLAAPGGCLQFYYHMYGEDIGTLNVYLNGSLIWSLTGERGNLWLRANVELNLAEAAGLIFQISFEAVILNNRGPSIDLRGDIAIDDVLVTTTGPCGQTSETPPPKANTTATPPQTDPPPVSPTRPCDFESDTCGFFNKRQALVWTRGNGGSVPGHQPQTDSTYGNSTGMFMYYDGRSAATEGNSSILVSPRIYDVGCISFNYFISGVSPCILNVLIATTNVDTIWRSVQGSERDRWIHCSVDLNAVSGRISFEAVHDSGNNFIIAIDDIRLTETRVCVEAINITDTTALVFSSTVSGTAARTVSYESKPTSGSTDSGTELASGEGDSSDLIAVVVGAAGAALTVIMAALITVWILKKQGKCMFSLPGSGLSIKYSQNRGRDQAYLNFDSHTYSDT